VSLNEEQSLWNLTSALIYLILENVIPKGGLSLIALDARCGLSSFYRMSFYLRRKDDLIYRFCLILGNVTPKDGQSWCEEKKFLIPKGDLNGRLAYARLWNLNHGNLNRVIQSFYRHRKDDLTSSYALGGRFFPGRSEAYLTTLFFEFCHLMILVRGHLTLEHRRNFWFRALRGLLLCDEACDRLLS
jgi:hypothetical protein